MTPDSPPPSSYPPPPDYPIDHDGDGAAYDLVMATIVRRAHYGYDDPQQRDYYMRALVKVLAAGIRTWWERKS